MTTTPSEKEDSQSPSLKARIDAFENFARQASDEASLPGFDDEAFKNLFVIGYKWDLAALHEALKDRLTSDHLRIVMDSAMDAKLQLMYLVDLRAGMAEYEWFLEQSGARKRKPALFKLRSMAQLQDEIAKIRIFWERFMILVYALETGEALHDMKKIKTKFFAEMAKHAHWNWLLPYEEEIEEFDAKYRTAELHKGSVLRAKLFDVGKDFHNDILRLQNLAMNQLWDNLSLIAQGVTDPRRFSYGMAQLKREGEIDFETIISGTGFARKPKPE